jgi:hypothetical protein
MVKPESDESPVYLWVRDELGTDARRVRNWNFFNLTPGLETFGTRIARYQALGQEPPESGLIAVPETIAFTDEDSKNRASRLLLRDEDYVGPNASRLLDDIAASNACIRVTASSDRRSISVAVGDAMRSCTIAGDKWNVCSDVPCPRR